MSGFVCNYLAVCLHLYPLVNLSTPPEFCLLLVHLDIFERFFFHHVLKHLWRGFLVFKFAYTRFVCYTLCLYFCPQTEQQEKHSNPLRQHNSHNIKFILTLISLYIKLHFVVEENKGQTKVNPCVPQPMGS